jgi:phosphonate transport system substrate-binding protein
MMAEPVLRFTTWLSPGLPEGYFATIAEHVATELGCRAELTLEPKISGPLTPDEDRFSLGLTDIGFLCPPSLLWLIDREPPSVRLVPMAAVYDDPRCQGRPVYFSDVITRADSGIESFDDLAGRRVGYNEPASLSGYVSMVGRLDRDGRSPSWFGEFRQVGSHAAALDLIVAGELDAAAVDTNVWRTWQADNPDRRARLSAIDVIGPNPVQPVVVAEQRADELVGPVARALASPALAAAVAPFAVTGFAPVSMADYDTVRPMLQATNQL